MAKRTKRFMETIRQKGGLCLGIFLGIFLISVFAGLGISGGFSFKGCSMQQPEGQTAVPRVKLDTSPEKAIAMLFVNGAPVDEALYYESLTQILDYIRSNDRDDPAAALFGYGYAASQLVMQKVTQQRGDELGVKVTNEDVKEEKDKAIAPFMSGEEGSTGNILGDLAQKMGSNREVKAAFNKFLATQGISEQQWHTETTRNIQMRKTHEQLQTLIDEEKALQANEDKAVIDQRLADGESFAELAKEYSDAPGENLDEPLWIGRELALPQQADAMFGTDIGEITDWIEVPSGWYRFNVLDRKMAEGEEFEAKRSDIILQLNSLNADKEDYEPTEEEIASKYEQAQVIQIQLRIDDPGAANRELDKLMQEAHVEVNDPFILAYQALMLDHIQPPAIMDYEQLVNIAKTAHVGEEYDFLLIQQKLDKALEMRVGELEGEEETTADSEDGLTEATDDDTAPEGEESTEGSTDEEGVDKGGDDSAATDAVSEDEEDQFYPLYPLAIGLFKMAIQDNEEAVGYLPYYLIADIYIKWLNDEDTRVKQPLERAAAREEIETNLARAAESNDYSHMLHAQRGLNLAWLERKEEAIASLALAIKYAPHDDQNPVWEIVREGYEVADAQDELAEFEAKITEYRQAALQAQIEAAQREARTQQQTQVINIPGDEDSEAGNGPSADESADDSVADGGGADAVDEAAEGE